MTNLIIIAISFATLKPIKWNPIPPKLVHGTWNKKFPNPPKLSRANQTRKKPASTRGITQE